VYIARAAQGALVEVVMSKAMIVLTPPAGMGIDELAKRLAVAIYHPTAAVFDHESYRGSKQIGASNDFWLHPGPRHGFEPSQYVLQARYEIDAYSRERVAEICPWQWVG
jgi:hypothetical protein